MVKYMFWQMIRDQISFHILIKQCTKYNVYKYLN